MGGPAGLPQHLHRRLVRVDHGAVPYRRPYAVAHVHEPPLPGEHHPVGEVGAADVAAQLGERELDAVERKRQRVLLVDRPGDQRGRGERARERLRGPRRAHQHGRHVLAGGVGLAAGRAGVDVGAVLLADEVRGHHAELAGDLDPDLAHLRAARGAAAAALGQVVLDDDGLEAAHVHPAGAAAPPPPRGRAVGGDGLGRAVGGGLAVVEERELAGDDALGVRPEEGLLQQLELLDEPGVLGALRVYDRLHLRAHGGHGLRDGGLGAGGGLRALALQVRRERLVVGGELGVVGGERRQGALEAAQPVEEGLVLFARYVLGLSAHSHIIPHNRR